MLSSTAKKIRWNTFADYFKLIIGVILFAGGYSCFMLPYKIVSGGMGGISALIFFKTGFPAQYCYFIINMILLLCAWRILGFKYVFRTITATVLITGAMSIFQSLILQDDGTMLRLVGEDRFMAIVIGGCIEGLGLATVFQAGGSTGGTDIIASCVNKYKDIQLGSMLLYLDLFIVGCSYFIQGSLEDVVVGYSTMFVAMYMLDHIMNSANQSVQFTIISNEYEEIANTVNFKINRGVTMLNGEGWYSKEKRPVLIIMAKKREKKAILQAVQSVDPSAFVTVSNVEGVFGEGFDKIKK